MALLTPNATATVLGVKVNEKIIPDGTRWQDATKAKNAGFAAGALYKAEKLICGTGKPTSVTIHNTGDLAGVYDDAEQYTRATFNQNMNSSRVHYFVDDVGAWQNLRAGTGLFPADPVGKAEVSWHAGDGSVQDGGNVTSLSIEIIMGETAATDKIAYDNGARLAAWLLHKHGLTVDNLVTHTYWVNKMAGKSLADKDAACTNPISGKKWCPTYIFNSNNAATAKKNWLAFVAVVKGYLDELNGTQSAPSAPAAPASGTKIMGKAVATADQMRAYVKAKNPSVAQSVIDMIPYYISEGEAEGVRGDVAFAQSCLETGNFGFAGSAVTLDQNNFCGMGVTSNGMKGNSFATPQLGIRAQIQHLKAYASNDALKQTCIDPRFGYVTRGCAETVEHLGQQENPDGKGWATGAGYGSKILSILDAVIATKPAASGGTTSGNQTPVNYLIKVTAASLDYRKGPGKSYGVAGTIKDKGTYTIVAEQDGFGKLKSGAGWIDLNGGGFAKQGASASAPASQQHAVPYLVKVTADALNYRNGPGTGYAVNGTIKDKGVYTIVAVKAGTGSAAGWGKLKSGAGWISLDYATYVRQA